MRRMHDAPPQERYTSLAVLMHWAVAMLVFFQLGLGWYMEGLPKGPDRSAYFALHKSIGLTIFSLAALRLVWRATHPPPPLPASLPRWQNVLARCNHKLLYVLMFLQPVSGYLSSSFSGYTTSFFGFPLPHWGWKEPFLNELFSDIHEVSAITLAALVGVHALAAVAHAVRPGDHLFRRMLPRSLVP
ncbi:MAG: cytochrome b [Gammaproteobacteria bacterium]